MTVPTTTLSHCSHTAHGGGHTASLTQDNSLLAPTSLIRHYASSSVLSVADISRTPTKRRQSPLLTRRSLQVAATITLRQNVSNEGLFDDLDLSTRQSQAPISRFDYAGISVWYNLPPMESLKQRLGFSQVHVSVCEEPVEEVNSRLSLSQIFTSLDQAPVNADTPVDEACALQYHDCAKPDALESPLASVILSRDEEDLSGAAATSSISVDHMQSSCSDSSSSESRRTSTSPSDLVLDTDELDQYGSPADYAIPTPDLVPFQDVSGDHELRGPSVLLDECLTVSSERIGAEVASVTTMFAPPPPMAKLENNVPVAPALSEELLYPVPGGRVLPSEWAVYIQSPKDQRVHVKTHTVPATPDLTRDSSELQDGRYLDRKPDECEELHERQNTQSMCSISEDASSLTPVNGVVQVVHTDYHRCRPEDVQYIEDASSTMSMLFLSGIYTGGCPRTDYPQTVAAWNKITRTCVGTIPLRSRKRVRCRKGRAELRGQGMETSTLVHQQVSVVLLKEGSDPGSRVEASRAPDAGVMVAAVKAKAQLTETSVFGTSPRKLKPNVRLDFTNLATLATHTISSFHPQANCASTQVGGKKAPDSSLATEPSNTSEAQKIKSTEAANVPSSSLTKSVRFVEQVEVRITGSEHDVPAISRRSRKSHQGPLQSILNKSTLPSKLQHQKQFTSIETENQIPEVQETQEEQRLPDSSKD